MSVDASAEFASISAGERVAAGADAESIPDAMRDSVEEVPATQAAAAEVANEVAGEEEIKTAAVDEEQKNEAPPADAAGA